MASCCCVGVDFSCAARAQALAADGPKGAASSPSDASKVTFEPGWPVLMCSALAVRDLVDDAFGLQGANEEHQHIDQGLAAHGEKGDKTLDKVGDSSDAADTGFPPLPQHDDSQVKRQCTSMGHCRLSATLTSHPPRGPVSLGFGCRSRPCRSLVKRKSVSPLPLHCV
jgi:hypothetical protein